MSLLEKINASFEDIKIKFDSPQATRNVHIYADYIELVSLFSNNNLVTTTDILDRFKDEGLIKQKKSDEDQAEANDGNEVFVNTIFQLLTFRGNIYNADYPFLINSKTIILKSKTLNNKQKLYIYLLLSSNLNIFLKFHTELTTEFEKLCYYTLKDFLPKHSVVKQMGKNSDYSGTALDKIQQLANDIKISTNEKHFNNTNIAGNQERGLDIIGWIPFKDNVPNKLIIMGQCACGKEWYNKLSETKRYEKYWHLDCRPIHTIFIPYSLIQESNSNFFQSDEINNILVFERGRILEIINDFDFIDNFECMQLVDKCLEYEEDIL